MKTTRERLVEFLKSRGEEIPPELESEVDDILSFVESEKAIQREEIKAEILRRRNKLVDKAMSSETGELIKEVVIECCDGLVANLTPNHNG